MKLHVANLSESFTTSETLVRSFVGVKSHVRLKVNELRECFSTAVADVWLDIFVNGHHVPLDAVRVGR